MQSCQLERRPQKFVTLRVFPGDDIEANDRLGSYLLSNIFLNRLRSGFESTPRCWQKTICGRCCNESNHSILNAAISAGAWQQLSLNIFDFECCPTRKYRNSSTPHNCHIFCQIVAFFPFGESVKLGRTIENFVWITFSCWPNCSISKARYTVLEN